MSDLTPEPRRRRRFAPLLLVAGVASAIVLSLSMTNTFSAFTAAITNSTNNAATGTLILQETNSGGSVTCNSNDSTGANAGNTINQNTAICAGINKYGGTTTLVPTNGLGTTNLQVTTVNFKNTGTGTAGSFTLTPGACTQSTQGAPNGNATDLCGKLNIVIKSGTTAVATGTATSLAGTTITLPIPAPAPGGIVVPFTFTVSLDNSAGNSYQNLVASQPLVWTLSS